MKILLSFTMFYFTSSCNKNHLSVTTPLLLHVQLFLSLLSGTIHMQIEIFMHG